jgi:hypothetical protein
MDNTNIHFCDCLYEAMEAAHTLAAQACTVVHLLLSELCRVEL